MSLIDRLSGFIDETEVKLSVNSFHASLYELSEGQLTRNQIAVYFGLSPEEETELDFIIGRYNAQPNANARAKFVELMRVLFILAEEQAPGYTTNAEIVARINAI